MKTRVAAIVFCFAITGCVSNEIRPEEANSMAVLRPLENKSSMISDIDGNTTLSLAGTFKLVTPGRHVVTTTTCPDGVVTRCPKRKYTFSAEAGMTYTFKSPTLIEVMRTSDKAVVDSLIDTGGGNFANRSQRETIRSIQKDIQASSNEMVLSQRRANLPQIRKVGARICQTRPGSLSGTQYVYVGYVEGLTDEKVQIRISDAFYKGTPNLRPGDFSPSIIWDNPLNWDLCE